MQLRPNHSNNAFNNHHSVKYFPSVFLVSNGSSDYGDWVANDKAPQDR
jgi:hypothetical protein